jgi:3-oxoacyl-[acyl-carrier protein] reductase
VNRVALVSGGSRGIGAATVLRLARDGFDVSFCYRTAQAAAEELAKAASEYGTRVQAQRADVSDTAQAKAWVFDVERNFGPVSVVVTSAGITRDKPLALMSDADWNDVLSVNLNGVHNVCKPAVFAMMKRRAGCVVTLSSVSGVYGHATQVNYSASKAGIIGFTRALAKEVGSYGIRVNAIAPGLIETDMTSPLGEQLKERWMKSIPLGRFGRADEVADLVSYLASDNASYITGSTVEIHGGITI